LPVCFRRRVFVLIAVCSVAAAAGCSRRFYGSFPRAVVITGAAPRGLEARTQIEVPLTLDASPLPCVGRNLLGAADVSPIVRPYGDWLDRRFLFLSVPSVHHGPCYDLGTKSYVDSGLCRDAGREAAVARRASDVIIANDLQDDLRGRLSAAGTR